MDLIESFVDFKFYRRPIDTVKCLVEEEGQSNGVLIKLYHTYNVIFDDS